VDLSQWPALNIAGVAISANQRSAFINRTYVEPGEDIEGVTVLEVTRSGVYLRYRDETVFIGKGRSIGAAPMQKKKSTFW
jgi:hypothetical protein